VTGNLQRGPLDSRPPECQDPGGVRGLGLGVPGDAETNFPKPVGQRQFGRTSSFPGLEPLGETNAGGWKRAVPGAHVAVG
jgi:hypothetical protein